MAHTVTGKLNKPANQFAAGEYTGFGVRLGVQYYDRKTKQKEWTNYSAVLFASQPAKIKYYADVLIAGAVIEVSGDSLKIDTYEGNHSIELLNASLGYTYTPKSSDDPTQHASGNRNQPNPTYEKNEFNDEIPF